MKLSKKATKIVNKLIKNSTRRLKDAPEHHVGSLSSSWLDGWNGCLNHMSKQINEKENEQQVVN